MPETARTFLMFQGGAEAALQLYEETFATAEVAKVERFAEGEGPVGSLKLAELSIGGHRLMLFDSPTKHDFGFTPSTSLFLDCEDETTIGRYAAVLSDGGRVMMPLGNYGFSRQFAWVQDRFGVSWQLNLP